MRELQIATAILASISFGLLLAALVSDYWVTFSLGRKGLWRSCSGFICRIYGMNVQDYLHATRFFLMVGMFAGAVSFLSLWAFIFNQSIGSYSMTKIAGITSLVAGLFVLIAMSIFTGKYNSYSVRVGHYGWSFSAGWASFPLFLLTRPLCGYCITLLLDSCEDEEEKDYERWACSHGTHISQR